MPDGLAYPEPAGAPQEKSSRGIPWLWVGAFLLFYPLSAGPVIKLWDRGVLPQQALVVYAPLGFVCEHFGPAKAVMEWYVTDVWHWSPPYK